ncbi:MAG: M4 family metallopeptidase, partial [Phycisphaerae bacterium]
MTREDFRLRFAPLVTIAVVMNAIAVDFAAAQPVPQGLAIERDAAGGRATFVTAEGGGAIALWPAAQPGANAATRFLDQYGSLFGVIDARTQLANRTDQVDLLARTRTSFEQVHHGIPVFSGVLRIHQDAAGQVVAANGDIYPISPKLGTVPTLTADDAAIFALAEFPGDTPTVHESTLMIVDPGWYGDPPAGARLVYYVVVFDAVQAMEMAYFVDSHTGEMLDAWSLVHTFKQRAIHDAAGTPAIPGPVARLEGGPPSGITDVDRAYDYYGDTYDYFLRAFGRDSIDGSGRVMRATVNFSVPGFCPNAFWSGTLLQMVFCTGLVSDDIVGHELTHGVTQFTASLIYQNQSGQLNESFSDVFGELIDQFNGDPIWPSHPTGPGLDTPNNPRTACSSAPGYGNGVRWLLGEDLLDVPPINGPIRDMWNPPCFSDPDKGSSSFQTCPTSDSGGVHIGSGIPNHAFAMLTDGKTFNGFTVNGIGPVKSGAVWYRGLATYLTPASDFRDAYVAFNKAAADLIGTTPNDPRTGLPSGSMFTAADAAEVDKALLAVEMNSRGRCGASGDVLSNDTPFECDFALTVYFDDFEAGAPGWTVSNTGPPTPYDWQLVNSLPSGRSGAGWFCADLHTDCTQNEAALHSLMSPTIDLPPGADYSVVSFDHYIEAEGDWDGGNVRLRVNGGSWQPVPRTAFLFNPYNARLRNAT